MRRAKVWELSQQIAVRPNPVFCHLADCLDRQENIDNISHNYQQDNRRCLTLGIAALFAPDREMTKAEKTHSYKRRQL
jgi:hypothetical protein